MPPQQPVVSDASFQLRFTPIMSVVGFFAGGFLTKTWRGAIAAAYASEKIGQLVDSYNAASEQNLLNRLES